jgi:hypothetical protein
MNLIELPARKDLQSLDGYVRENLERLEQELLVGVPYKSLGNATQAAGFAALAARSLRSSVHRARKKRGVGPRSLTRPPVVKPWLNRSIAEGEPAGQPEDDSVLLARRLRQLVRSPRPGTDEQDLLV